MSRGFDGFEIDDFRDSPWESESSSRSRESSRGRGGSSQTEASVRIKLAKLREAEGSMKRADAKLAKELGLRLCDCEFPPNVMLWRETEKAHVCPRCQRRREKPDLPAVTGVNYHQR